VDRDGEQERRVNVKVNIHRREQWDLTDNNVTVKPWIACHVQRGHVTRRLFVIWRNGFRGFGVWVRWGVYE
jgi:hypothetical protein